MSLFDPTAEAMKMKHMDAVSFDAAHDRELERGQPKDKTEQFYKEIDHIEDNTILMVDLFYDQAYEEITDYTKELFYAYKAKDKEKFWDMFTEIMSKAVEAEADARL